jgi:NUMOD4 motif
LERWKTIPEFPNYEVSTYGQIRNQVADHIMARVMNQYGVVFVGLYRRGEQFKRSVPKLVAKAFIPNPFEAYDTPINLDGDRWNNSVDNLVWRPRWFAVRYNWEIRDGSDFHIPLPLEDIQSKEISENSYECARTYGLLEKDLVLSIMNRTYVWPTYQQFRVIED